MCASRPVAYSAVVDLCYCATCFRLSIFAEFCYDTHAHTHTHNGSRHGIYPCSFIYYNRFSSQKCFNHVIHVVEIDLKQLGEEVQGCVDYDIELSDRPSSAAVETGFQLVEIPTESPYRQNRRTLWLFLQCVWIVCFSLYIVRLYCTVLRDVSQL